LNLVQALAIPTVDVSGDSGLLHRLCDHLCVGHLTIFVPASTQRVN
jgi:hypothetical protein